MFVSLSRVSVFLLFVVALVSMLVLVCAVAVLAVALYHDVSALHVLASLVLVPLSVRMLVGSLVAVYALQ